MSSGHAQPNPTYYCPSASSPARAPVLPASPSVMGPPGPPPTFHLLASGAGGYFYGQDHRGGQGHGYKRCDSSEILPTVGNSGLVLVTDSGLLSRPVNSVPEVSVSAAVPLVTPNTQPSLQPPIVNVPVNGIPSPRRVSATRKAYARLDTGVLMPIPPIPFATDHNVSDLVQFTSASRDAVSSLRVACDDTHPYLWTVGWEKCTPRTDQLTVAHQ